MIVNTQQQYTACKEELFKWWCKNRPFEVLIDEPKPPKRKDIQNRLQQHWFNEMVAQSRMFESRRGWSRKDYVVHCKRYHGIPIMCADEWYNRMWLNTSASLSEEDLPDFIHMLPVTRMMGVKQMRMYLDEVYNQIGREWGFTLTSNEDKMMAEYLQ